MSRCDTRPRRPITRGTEVRGMTARGIDPTLQTSVTQGQYEVDSREVAEAIVRSWMLVAAEPGQGAVRAGEEGAAPGETLADPCGGCGALGRLAPLRRNGHEQLVVVTAGGGLLGGDS